MSILSAHFFVCAGPALAEPEEKVNQSNQMSHEEALTSRTGVVLQGPDKVATSAAFPTTRGDHDCGKDGFHESTDVVCGG